VKKIPETDSSRYQPVHDRGPGKKKRCRLDLALPERGLAENAKKALALIMAGEVLVNGNLVDEPGFLITAEDQLTLRQKFPYVSRGALKIARAVATLNLALKGRRVLDIGISSGGFSDYALQNGAAAVIGVDVNLAQVSELLKNDSRVNLLRINARNLKPGDLPWTPDLVLIDVSFISILTILRALLDFPEVEILALVKPQFEGSRKEVGSRGVVNDPDVCRRIVDRVRCRVEECGFRIQAEVAAGIKGRQGNQEYFLLMRRGAGDSKHAKIGPEVDHG